MKKLKTLFISLLTVLFVVASGMTGAAASDIVIKYTDGKNVTEIATEDPTLINSLEKLVVDSKNVTVTGTAWSDGFFSAGDGSGGTLTVPVKYIKLTKDQTLTFDTNAQWRYKGSKYDAILTLKQLTNSTNNEVAFAVVVGDNTTKGHYFAHAGAIDGGIKIEDKDGKTLVKSININGHDDPGLFAEIEVKLVYTGTNKKAPIEIGYYQFSDIDASQSFAVENVALSNTNLFVANKANWPTSGYQNMANGGSIYSQHAKNSTTENYQADEAKKVDAYVKVTKLSGINKVIYGYASYAGAGFGIYAKLVTANYKSDAYGTIADGALTTEKLYESDLASGSIQVPNEGYWFKGWVADKDVVLPEKTIVKAGTLLTDDEVKSVSVMADIDGITFTAIHAPTVKYQSDEFGVMADGAPTYEEVEFEANPSGSLTDPNEGYHLAYWTCDKDVTIVGRSGSVAAGTPLTEEDVKNVVVNEPLVFTAHHAPSVTYQSDSNGVMADGAPTFEEVDMEGNPSGSLTQPNDGYWFSHWVCDKDVTIVGRSGVVAAGTPLTLEEVQNVVVTEPLAFTGIHAPSVKYQSDSNGTMADGALVKEDVDMEGNPTGSLTVANEGYWFTYWVCDKEVSIKGIAGNVSAGTPLTLEEVQNVVVTEPLTFTGIHAPTVTYDANKHGTVSIDYEEVDMNGNPAGSVCTPNNGYLFTGWTCDKDVTLTDGTVIAAGTIMTDDQVKQVVVTEPLNFVAHYRVIDVPNTGFNSGIFMLCGIAEISIIGLIALVLILKKNRFNF